MAHDDLDDYVIKMRETWILCPERSCPKCFGPVEEQQWWDDLPSDGGAYIGFRLRCMKCDYEEDF